MNTQHTLVLKNSENLSHYGSRPGSMINTINSLNYPCLEHIFEPLKSDRIYMILIQTVLEKFHHSLLKY